MYRIEIAGRIPSLNDFYSGAHWSHRAKMASQWHETMIWEMRAQELPKTILAPFTLSVDVYRKRVVDNDNAVMSAKFFVDALKQSGRIKDDSPDYWKALILRSHKGKKDTTVFTIE